MITLSGGDLGGSIVDLSNHSLNEEVNINGYIYRIISENLAIYVGVI